jgi:hypothetical protein
MSMYSRARAAKAPEGPQYGAGSTIDALDNIEIDNVGSMNELATPWYSDQILPFDVTLAGANEYGAMAAAKIFGLEILNEGTGHSIDDAVTEMQATFVARAIEPMQAVPNKTWSSHPAPTKLLARARRHPDSLPLCATLARRHLRNGLFSALRTPVFIARRGPK